MHLKQILSIKIQTAINLSNGTLKYTNNDIQLITAIYNLNKYQTEFPVTDINSVLLTVFQASLLLAL